MDLLLRSDSAILVVRTSKGYLITYSIATDGESRVYKPQFHSSHNVQRRKQSLIAGQSGLRPDQFLWGPGEGSGVRDVSVRFRMVIKIDAGIESAIALDDELVVATKKPAAVQCIRWTPDSTGNQTRTEILSRMSWVEKKVSIVEMTHDRPMNLATWITSDGRAYAVQRQQPNHSNGDDPEGAEAKRLFKGHCFHTPKSQEGDAVHAVINARFSLIAVACADGTVHVYSVRDYAGNIVHSHTHHVPSSRSNTGAFMSLSYSPDGYCLFAGLERGWSTWSMFGKLGSHSFGAEDSMSNSNGEQWLSGVIGVSWIGGGSEVLIVGRRHEAIWSLEMAKSAVTGCYNDANVFRTVLQTPTGIMVYRGYDLPDMTSISAEPFLWHTAKIPPAYLLNQWPIKQAVISPDGRYIAVAGRRGLAHYSVNSGRWKTFADEVQENEFQVRGGMCWYQHVLVAAVEGNRTYELRLYSRESNLDAPSVLYTQQLPAPVVLITASGEDSLLVYTYENLLYHFIFTPWAGSTRLVQVGQIAFHGIVRSPARVRGLSWILPEDQLLDGDPSQDVAVASVIFLVDGKLVLLSPSLNETGQLKYDMRVIAQNVEYHASMRDHPHLNVSGTPQESPLRHGPPALRDSLWLFDGQEVKGWANINEVLVAASGDGARDLPPPISVAVDFYPLSILLEKGIILGVESDLVQRRDLNFSFFHFSIRVGNSWRLLELNPRANFHFRPISFFPTCCVFIYATTRLSKLPNCHSNMKVWNTLPTGWRFCSIKFWMKRPRRHRNQKLPSCRVSCHCCHHQRNTLTLCCSAREKRKCDSGRPYSPIYHQRKSCLKNLFKGDRSRQQAATSSFSTPWKSFNHRWSNQCECYLEQCEKATGSSARSWRGFWQPWMKQGRSYKKL